MMFRRRKQVTDLSLEELEQALRLKRRQERQERFIRLSTAGESAHSALVASHNAVIAAPTFNAQAAQSEATDLRNPLVATPVQPKGKRTRDFALLVLEIGALIGLVAVLISSYLNLRVLNSEAVEAQSANRLNQVVSERLFEQPQTVAPEPVSFIHDLLPGGHSSPSAAGGAIPEIPSHLQNWVQPPPIVPVEAQDAEAATRIVIPKIDVDAAIIQGVGWEDLKKGVGQLPNSAYPGQRGNLYLAAHNDIYGEIFRYLEKLEPGDEYHIYAGEAKFTYVVREKRIIEPDEVEVMLPTTEPVATLQTCYPYLIDTHRLIVVSDLVN